MLSRRYQRNISSNVMYAHSKTGFEISGRQSYFAIINFVFTTAILNAVVSLMPFFSVLFPEEIVFSKNSRCSILKFGSVCFVNSAHFNPKFDFKNTFLTVSCKINTYFTDWQRKRSLQEISRGKSNNLQAVAKKSKFSRFSAK